jgi:hypothetical protein
MLLFCPECQSAFTGVSRCPRCGGLLLMPEEAPPAADAGSYAPEAVELTPPFARVVVGTVVGLGLYLGLRKLSAGFVLAILHEAESWWQSSEALTAIFILQLVSCGFGALLASAGRTRGIALGAGVGTLCGGLFLLAESLDGAPPTQLVFLLQPVLMTICAAIAGAVGSWVWAAVPELDMPAPLVKKSSSIELLQEKPKHAERPTKWLRVIVGSIVIVAGMGLAEKARIGAEKASGGMLRVESRGQGKFMSWQIATLAVLAGGAFAGATTGAGLRHGVFVGLIGAFGGGALMMMRSEFTQPEEYLLKYMNLAVTGPGDPVAVLGIGFGILVATLVGGWFGGQLFPPLAPEHMRRRNLHAFD